MIEAHRRQLRNNQRQLRNNRRPPNYLSSEVAMLSLQQQEAEQAANMRNSTGESRSAATSLNAMAKVLNKFIRQISIRYEENLKLRPLNNSANQKKQLRDHQPKNTKFGRQEKQMVKRLQKQSKIKEDEANKKNKQLQNFKAQHALNLSQNGSRHSEQEKFLTREAMAANAQENALNMMSLQFYPLLNCLPNAKTQPLNFSDHIQQKESIQHGQVPKSQLQKYSKLPFQSNTRQGSKISVIMASDAKLFKRASYHVAIAYHIYIKKLKMRGNQLITRNDLDPTNLARKIKEERTGSQSFRIEDKGQKQNKEGDNSMQRQKEASQNKKQ